MLQDRYMHIKTRINGSVPFLSLLQEMKGCSIHECKSQETPNYSTCGKQITICFNSTPDNPYHFNVKTARASFFIMLFFTSRNRANPSSNLFRKDHHLHLQVEKLWQKLCQVVTEQGRGKSRNVSWLGGPFPSPHPGALGLLHIQLLCLPWRWAITVTKLQRKLSLHSVNGILTFIASHSSHGCGKAPLIIWAVSLLLNKIGPGSVLEHWLRSICAA